MSTWPDHRCPDWIFLGMSVRVLQVTLLSKIWTTGHSDAEHFPSWGWAPSNPLRTWTVQTGKGGTYPFPFCLLDEVEFPSFRLQFLPSAPWVSVFEYFWMGISQEANDKTFSLLNHKSQSLRISLCIPIWLSFSIVFLFLSLSSNKTTLPKPIQTMPSTGDQAFKCPRLWRTFLLLLIQTIEREGGSQ